MTTRPIKVLANADRVIRALSESGALTPAELAEAVDIPRPSVYRLIDGMTAIGLTESLPDGTARLSMRWLRMADRARAAMPEWEGADDVLRDLVERTQQTAYLTIERDGEAVCIAWEQGRGIGVLVLKPGRSLPLHAGAAGRALLAFGGGLEAELVRGREEGAPRTRFTRATLTTDEELRADAEAALARGYSVSIEDVTPGIAAFGAPVRQGGHVIGAISIAGLTAEFEERREELAEALLGAAARLGD